MHLKIRLSRPFANTKKRKLRKYFGSLQLSFWMNKHLMSIFKRVFPNRFMEFVCLQDKKPYILILSPAKFKPTLLIIVIKYDRFTACFKWSFWSECSLEGLSKSIWLLAVRMEMRSSIFKETLIQFVGYFVRRQL